MSKSEDSKVNKTLIQIVLGNADDPVRSEREQALLRIIIPVVFFFYLLTDSGGEKFLNPDHQHPLVFVGGFLFVALLLLTSTFTYPVPSLVRRGITIFIDMAATSYLMYLSGAAGAPWFGVYLWIIFGNTLRYGGWSLYFSTVLAVTGFSIVLLGSNYWHENISMGIGVLVSLLVLPGYAAALAQRLRNAQLAAENANQAKSQFLAIMSHEIRTPLNGIIGATELLQERKLPDEDKRFVDIINHSGSTLLQLINNILDLSKIEANKLVGETVSFDLHEFFGSLTDMMNIQAQKKGIRLSSIVDPRISYHLMGDEHFLKQVLINLLGNGIKFTEKGEVELRCELAGPIPDSGPVILRFSVRDTGIGIPLEQQEKILEPFVQAENSTSRRFGGTGLGTAIARDLVELMGGELSLESVPGEGTTFHFTLPLVLDAAAANTSDQLPMVGRTVLSLIRDEDSEAVVSSRLQEWSLNVLSAADVSRAEQVLRKASRECAPIAAIVMDENFIKTMAFSLERWRREGLIPDDLTVVVASLKDEAPSFSEDKPGERLSSHLVWVESEEELSNALHAIRFPCDLGEDVLAEPLDEVQPLNILIADDNSTNRIILSSMLSNAGHRVIETDSGEAFLDAVEAEDFDLALVDMHMPDMNGIETFQLYRFAHVSEEAIPFIVITADVTEATHTACRDAGIDTTLSKPIDNKQLFDAIERLTKGESRVSPEEETVMTPASSDDVPMVDLGKVEELKSLDTGTGLVAHIVECFMEDAAETIVQMRTALQDRDYFGMKDLAHALRGSAANVGLLRVQLASEQLELQLETQFMQMSTSQIDQLEDLVQESAHLLAVQFGLEKPRPELRVVS